MEQLYKDRVKKVERILSNLRIAHRCGECACFHKNRAREKKVYDTIVLISYAF